MTQDPPAPDDPVLYDVRIRDLALVALVGDTVVEILQHDKEQFVASGHTFIELCFVSGRRLRCYGDGVVAYYEAGKTDGLLIGTRAALEDE